MTRPFLLGPLRRQQKRMKTVSNSSPIARGRIAFRETVTRVELQKCYGLLFSVYVQTRLEFANMYFDVPTRKGNVRNEKERKRERVLLRSILLEWHTKIILVHMILYI